MAAVTVALSSKAAIAQGLSLSKATSGQKKAPTVVRCTAKVERHVENERPNGWVDSIKSGVVAAGLAAALQFAPGEKLRL